MNQPLLEKQKPRHRRLDLINSMRYGDQKLIAQRVNCTTAMVSMVLNGKRSQTNDIGINIIRLAERFAERNRR